MYNRDILPRPIAATAVLAPAIVGTEESVDGDFPSSPPSAKRTEERRRETKADADRRQHCRG